MKLDKNEKKKNQNLKKTKEKGTKLTKTEIKDANGDDHGSGHGDD